MSAWMLPCRVCSSSTRSEVMRRCCSAAAATAARKVTGGHGLVRKRKICPSLTAATAELRSAWPVSRTRVASGTRWRARVRKVAPSMPGMRMSEITTAVPGADASISSAIAPLGAVATS
jgi:hypothetical protein